MSWLQVTCTSSETLAKNSVKYAAPTFDEAIKQSDAVSLLEELLPAQTHSYLLGLKLGLPVYTVDSICSTYQHPRDRLLHVLIAFLNQETPRPTWRLVVEALRSPAVDLPLLARKVETAHFPSPTATREVDDAAVTTTGMPSCLYFHRDSIYVWYFAVVYTAYILSSIAKTTNVDNSANTNAGKPGCFRFTPIYPDIHNNREHQ